MILLPLKWIPVINDTFPFRNIPIYLYDSTPVDM